MEICARSRDLVRKDSSGYHCYVCGKILRRMLCKKQWLTYNSAHIRDMFLFVVSQFVFIVNRIIARIVCFSLHAFIRPLLIFNISVITESFAKRYETFFNSFYHFTSVNINTTRHSIYVNIINNIKSKKLQKQYYVLILIVTIDKTFDEKE